MASRPPGCPEPPWDILSHPGTTLPARLALTMLNSKNVPEKQELVLMPEHIETAQLGCRNKILSTNKDKIYFMVLVMYIRKIQLEDYTYIHNL